MCMCLSQRRCYRPDGSFKPPYETCFPGLAMSRSLGDSCLDEIGVLPVPEVTIRGYVACVCVRANSHPASPVQC